MAGWIENLDSVLIPESGVGDEKLKGLFIDFVEVFLREILGISRFRPLPPLIGEGLEVDLFKLYSVVRNRGGCGDVFEKGFCWSGVAVECGFDSGYGPALKLVYVKYLEIVDIWLRKRAKDRSTVDKELSYKFSAFPMELDEGLKVFLSSVVPDKVKNGGEFVEVEDRVLGSGEEREGFVGLDGDVMNVDGEDLQSGNGGGGGIVSEKRSVELENRVLKSGEEGQGFAGLNVDVMNVDGEDLRNGNGGGDVIVSEKRSVELEKRVLDSGEEGRNFAGLNVGVVNVDDGDSRNGNGGGDVIVSEKRSVELKNHVLDSGEEGKSFAELNVGVMNVDDENSRNENEGGDVNVSEEPSIGQCGNGGDQLRDNDGDSISRKRKRDCYLPMLNWIRKVAENPCNPSIGSLPERHKWNHYGAELKWKQLLFVRQAMLLKKNIDANSEQSIWQKKQKMHPTMYDDHLGSERLRCSQRLVTVKDSSRNKRERLGSESSSSGCQSDKRPTNKKPDSPADSFINCRREKIPIGRLHQAELPKFCESRASYQSDSKWLGTRVWPLTKGSHNRNLIERDPIGKGRQESCGCTFPGSMDCVRFHIMEKRMRLKLELDSAFYLWKFHRIGEDVALSWTKEDENKFQDIVKSNRLSMDKYYWEELFKQFPKKGREALVNYYYNVFVLRRRGHQNRDGTSCIDSDDEESDYGPIGNRFGQLNAISPGSILCSPKKSQYNSR